MTGLPDFLVIGAARAGTTALYAALRQHPGLFLTPSKETNFFAYEGEKPAVRGPGAEFINNAITDLATYRTQFAAAPAGTLRGEVCPLYLHAPKAPERIRAHVPEARLVAILRNPVEQAFSHFLYARHNAIEPLSDFTGALAREDERLAAGWQPLFGYSRFPRYGEQLARYFARFPRERLLVLDYEDWARDNAAALARILGFIGADPAFRPVAEAGVNAGGAPRSAALQRLLMRPNPLTAIGRLLPLAWRRRLRDALAAKNAGETPRLPDEARAILIERLADDVGRLSDLLGRDYSRWLA
jgi:Sulfotransferase family